MAISKYQVYFTNSNIDPSNYQIVDFDIDEAAAGSYFTGESELAAILIYLTVVSGGFGAGTFINRVQYRAAGSPGYVPRLFPTTEYAAVRTDVISAGYSVPAMASGYATSLGSGILAPLGTSISVSELTATVGRTGRGRHFLPFVSQGVISAGGTVGTGHIALVEGAFLDILLGEAVGTVPGLLGDAVCISGPASPAAKLITGVKCQPIFSNLESRRR